MTEFRPAKLLGVSQRASCGGDFGRGEGHGARFLFSGSNGLAVHTLEVGAADTGSGFFDLEFGDCGEQWFDNLRGLQKFW